MAKDRITAIDLTKEDEDQQKRHRTKEEEEEEEEVNEVSRSKREKEVNKEVEWVVVTGGAWVPLSLPLTWEYKGDCVLTHVIKFPSVKELTWEALKDRVRALGFPMDGHNFGLSYLWLVHFQYHSRDRTQINLLRERDFDFFMNRVLVKDKELHKPVTLYHKKLPSLILPPPFDQPR